MTAFVLMKVSSGGYITKAKIEELFRNNPVLELDMCRVLDKQEERALRAIAESMRRDEEGGR